MAENEEGKPLKLGRRGTRSDGLHIKNQTLYVHITSPVLRQELSMGRDRILKNLNHHVGAQVITNIVIY